MKRIYIFLSIFLLYLSCRNTQVGQLMEIEVDIDKTVTFPLSMITDEITVIELELTNESITSPERIKQVLITENYLIIVESNNILVFNKNGNFIRSIGSRGQGPGDYNNIRNVTINEKSLDLYILNGDSKILCYNLNGNYLKQTTQLQKDGFSIYDLKYVNDILFLIVEQWIKNSNGGNKHSAIFNINEDFLIIDTCKIRCDGFEKYSRFYHLYENYLFCNNLAIYLYYTDLYPEEANPEEKVLRDTLYRFEKNLLIPELKLKFKKNEREINGYKYIYLFNIYKSSRYVFAVYSNKMNDIIYRYCFDTETKKGYNFINDEFIDDINLIKERVKIRPVTMNTELFFYLHTHIKDEDIEESNPTIYIGKLKK